MNDYFEGHAQTKQKQKQICDVKRGIRNSVRVVSFQLVHKTKMTTNKTKKTETNLQEELQAGRKGCSPSLQGCNIRISIH